MNSLEHDNAWYARDGLRVCEVYLYTIVYLLLSNSDTTSTEHPALTNMACCLFHCRQCLLCFKSRPCFRRHNCHLGDRITVHRSSFQHVCSDCNRWFPWHRDLKCLYCSSIVYLQGNEKSNFLASLFDESSLTR